MLIICIMQLPKFYRNTDYNQQTGTDIWELDKPISHCWEISVPPKKINNFIHSYCFIATRSPQDNGALFWENSQGFGICGQTSPLNQIYKPNTSAHINGHLWLSLSLKISRLSLASHTAQAKHTFIFTKSKSFYLLVASTSTRICTERWRFFHWQIHQVHQEDLGIGKNNDLNLSRNQPKGRNAVETENAAGWFEGIKANKMEHVIKLNHENWIHKNILRLSWMGGMETS